MKLAFVVVLVSACIGIARAEVGQTRPNDKEPLETKHELAPERGRRTPFPAHSLSHPGSATRSQADKADEGSSEGRGHGGGRGGGARGGDDDDGGDE